MEKNPLTLAQVTSGIYTCLEMLLVSNREDLHAWWCNLLYKTDGGIHYPMWSEYWLQIIENDVIYNV